MGKIEMLCILFRGLKRSSPKFCVKTKTVRLPFERRFDPHLGLYFDCCTWFVEESLAILNGLVHFKLPSTFSGLQQRSHKPVASSFSHNNMWHYYSYFSTIQQK